MGNQRKLGVLLSYASMAINIGVGLVTLPIMTAFMGTGEYGLFELMGSLIAYMSVLDFGLSATITRFYSQAMARGDEQEKENILAVAAIIYLGISALTVVLGAIGYQFLDPIYSGSLTAGELVSCKHIFLVLIFNMAVTIPSKLFVAVLTSEERFVFLRGVTMFSQALQPAVYILVLYFVPTAFAVCIIQTVFNLIVVALNAFYCVFRLHMKVKLHTFNRSIVFSMLSFSFFIFLHTVIDQMYWKTDILILGAVAGTAVTGIYGIASRITIMYMNFSATINNVFLPQISKIVLQSKDIKPIDAIMQKVGRIQFYVVSLILTGFICYGRQFLYLWVGSKYTDAQKFEAYIICLVVMIPLFVPLIQDIGIAVMQAMNKHAFRSIVYFFVALVNIAVSIPLAMRFGGLGCAMATSGAMLVGNICIINWYYWKKLKLDIWGFFGQILRMLPVPLFMLLFGTASNLLLPGNGWILFLAKGAVYCLLYAGLSWRFNMNDYEKNLFGSMLKKLKRA